MKIRIKGNSIRYRLSKSDIENLRTKGRVAEETVFGNQIFRYILEAAPVESITASFDNGSIRVQIPQATAIQWTETERVGFDARQDNGTPEQLYILLEKDFKCLDETIEDQSDNYENPIALKS